MNAINRIISDDPLFAEVRGDEETYDTMFSLLAERGISLPPFVEIKDKPQPRRVTLLGNGRFAVEGDNKEWESLEELYDQRDGELYFDESITASPQVAHKADQMVFLPKTDENNHGGGRGRPGKSRVILGHDYDEERKSLAYAYYQFLVAARAWEKNPKDFFTSYEFMIRHPAFWHVQKSSNPAIADEWVTDDGLIDMTISTFKNEIEGKHYICLEAGGTVRPDNTGFWRNDGLEVHALTMNEAYIALAAALNNSYDLSGAKRTPVIIIDPSRGNYNFEDFAATFQGEVKVFNLDDLNTEAGMFDPFKGLGKPKE